MIDEKDGYEFPCVNQVTRAWPSYANQCMAGPIKSTAPVKKKEKSDTYDYDNFQDASQAE